MSVLSSLRGRKASGSGAPTPETPPAEAHQSPYALTEAQIRFFETFGFVKLSGLFAAEADQLVKGFEEIFDEHREETWETNEALHFDERRMIIPNFVDRSPQLSWLVHDERVQGVVHSLIGADHERCGSDGNLFYCDTSWHPDSYGAPMTQYHVKLSFYLDDLEGENGAIRMMPGTNFYSSEYSLAVRHGIDDPAAIESVFGVAPQDIPSWTLDSRPGDVIVWSFRTVHASFNGGQRRRLFSMNFKEPSPPEA